ncbi:MAG: RNA polymerase sigma factor [Actinobacteria bacterium]|nr:RNA polymerase sigma factor [Actinomycetota bacterium]
MSPEPTAAPDDAALVTAARAGDRRALELLLEAHADRIHAVCRRIVGDPHDALDATQEAMIAVARGITRFDGTARFSTWCYRVATNAALDEVRRARRRPVAVEPSPTRGDPRDHTVGVDARLDVDAALATLAPEFRAAVVLRDLCDLDYAEVAEVLGVPPGTVRSRIARGRAALAAALGEPEPDPGRRKEEP